MEAEQGGMVHKRFRSTISRGQDQVHGARSSGLSMTMGKTRCTVRDPLAEYAHGQDQVHGMS